MNLKNMDKLIEIELMGSTFIRTEEADKHGMDKAKLKRLDKLTLNEVCIE